MKMWLKRATLVFLTAIAAMVTSGQDPVILDNKQRRVEVPFGSNLAFHCNLNMETYDRVRVSLYVNRSGSSINGARQLCHVAFNKSTWLSTNKTQPDDTLSKCTLSNATDENNGWYFCKVVVEIPMYETISSNGTQVIITTVSPTVDNQPINWWLWIPLAASGVVLIVLMLMYILLKRRCHSSRGDDPIYANTHPKQPSPRPGTSVDKLKVPSSQNQRNPSPGRTYELGKQRHR